MINRDQAGCSIVPHANRTMNPKTRERVSILGKEDKRQVTRVGGSAMSGARMKEQVIYQGKTERCEPELQYHPDGWDITHNERHWSNEEKVLQDLETIVVPYVEECRILSGQRSSTCSTCPAPTQGSR